LQEEPLGSIEKPLAGKRIVVTRAPEQARDLVRTLEALGAEVVLLPMVSFRPPEDWKDLDKQLRQLDSFDAILFLSTNAVRYLFDRCAQLGIEWDVLPSSCRFVAAVGSATARALEERGVLVHYVAEKRTGEALAHELSPSLAGRRVLLPRSDRGDERVRNELRAMGATVTEVVAYRTTGPLTLDRDLLARTRRAAVDAIVFASPSAAHTFARVIGETDFPALSTRVPLLAIGPTTAAAIRRSGGQVQIEAEEPSVAGIANALVQHFGYRSAPARRP
jgi:uroporphyrinogen III methyltransferase / synthase